MEIDKIDQELPNYFKINKINGKIPRINKTSRLII